MVLNVLGSGTKPNRDDVTGVTLLQRRNQLASGVAQQAVMIH